MSPRVLVDGWELQPDERRRGIGRFLDGVLPHVATADDVDVRVLQPAAEVGDVALPTGCRPHPVTRRVPRARVRAGIGEHVVRLAAELGRVPHDVAWAPGTLPLLRSPRPWVQTLHDLAPLVLDLPGYGFHRGHWRLLGPRVRTAARVVAVSRVAADEGVRLLGLDPRRVEVVPHGVDPTFRPDGPREDPGTRYVAAVTSDDPRKGLEDLAALAHRLASGSAPLHVAGRLGARWRDRLTGAGAVVRGHVVDLPRFLRGAAVTVVTSHYEGFGFVPLESMACGVPVVAYDAAAVAEVVADGGVLVATGDVAAVAGQVARLLDDDAARRDLATAGLARAARFRWELAGAAYVRVLGEAASDGSRGAP